MFILNKAVFGIYIWTEIPDNLYLWAVEGNGN